MTLARAAALAAAALLWAGAAEAALRYEGVLSTASGRYVFDERTTTVTLSNGLALETGRLTARAAWPLLYQNTTLVTASALGGIPSGGPMSGAVADSGAGGRGGRGGPASPARAGPRVPASSTSVPGYELASGDPVASASWRALAGSPWSASLGASVKAPIADPGDFGTGEWDYGVTAALARAVGTRATIGLDAAYWVLGDLPDLDFRNPVAGTASLGWLFSTRWAGVLSLAGSSGALRGYDAPISIGVAAHRYADSGRSVWSLSIAAGLTETASDVSVALGFGTGISGRRPLDSLD